MTEGIKKGYKHMDSTTIAVLKLLLVFGAIIVTLKFRWKLWQATIAATVVCIAAYAIPVSEWIPLAIQGATSSTTIQMVAVLYVVTLLQKMLEYKHQLEYAQKDLDRMFHNRRINATVAPMLIGLLPSAAAANICARIVDDAAGDSLTKEEKAFVTSYYRHIPESFWPTYTSIILMSQLSGVSLASMVGGMLPLVVVLYILGYIFYVRKIPRHREDGTVEDDPNLPQGFFPNLISLIKHLWALIAIVVLIMAFGVNILPASGIVIVAVWFVYKFKLSELGLMLKEAFEPNLIVSTFFIFMFNAYLGYTGVVNVIPDFFGKFPIPTFLIFSLIFFFGSIVSSSAILLTCTPIAFASIPGSGWPLLVLLNACSYAAMQIAPIHICLTIAADAFKVSLGALIKKTIPVIIVFFICCIAYYVAFAGL